METHEVNIDNFSFTPMEMTIPAGSQVTWINKDDVPHTVVSVNHQFKSKALDTDEKFSFTFPESRHLRVLLLGPSKNDRQDHREVTAQPCTHSVFAKRCWPNTRNTWC